MTDRHDVDDNPWADFVTPEREQAAAGADVADAHDLAIDEINPLNPHLFRDDRWHEHFRRLRAEDPVHASESNRRRGACPTRVSRGQRDHGRVVRRARDGATGAVAAELVDLGMSGEWSAGSVRPLNRVRRSS